MNAMKVRERLRRKEAEAHMRKVLAKEAEKFLQEHFDIEYERQKYNAMLHVFHLFVLLNREFGFGKVRLGRLWDALLEKYPSLIIDNCASGGKRLDLEMTYRSIPFWRSDYNCAVHSDLFEATQAQTYGLSFWLPISGTAQNAVSEYSLRSAITPLVLMDFFANYTEHFNLFHEQRELMTGNYYPLDFGSFDKNKMLSMQYMSEDALSGVVFVYKRPEVNKSEYSIALNGLVSDAIYEISDFDGIIETKEYKGSELMSEGITIPLPDGEKAIVLNVIGE